MTLTLPSFTSQSGVSLAARTIRSPTSEMHSPSNCTRTRPGWVRFSATWPTTTGLPLTFRKVSDIFAFQTVGCAQHTTVFVKQTTTSPPTCHNRFMVDPRLLVLMNFSFTHLVIRRTRRDYGAARVVKTLTIRLSFRSHQNRLALVCSRAHISSSLPPLRFDMRVLAR